MNVKSTDTILDGRHVKEWGSKHRRHFLIDYRAKEIMDEIRWMVRQARNEIDEMLGYVEPF